MSVTKQRRSAHLDEVYPMLPFEPVSGSGVYLQDAAGRKILDFYGGHAVAALGYGHPKLTAALVSQVKALQFQSNVVPLKIRDAAADALADFAPAGLDRVFFVNSGAEANENALKLALKLTGRRKVIAIEHGFHGRTAAAAAVTFGAADTWYGFPQTPMDVEFVPRDDCDAMRAAVDSQTAAVIIEPVQGLAGAYDFSHEFMQCAREATSKVGAMLILDEVQTGIGRLGEAFGASIYKLTPDLLTTAKGLAGGLPAGAVIMRDDMAKQLSAGELGTTFGGAPIACAAIIAVIEAIKEESLLENVRELNKRIADSCITGPIDGMQGLGFLVGLRSQTKAVVLRNQLMQRDILTGTSADPYVLRLLPPLILNADHVDSLAAALTEITNESL